MGQAARQSIENHEKGIGKQGRKNFLLLLLGSTVSSAGDSLTFIAFGYLAYSYTESTVIYSLTLVCHFLPNIIGSFVSGPMVDRHNPVHLMVYADLFRAAVLVIFVAVNVYLGFSYWSVFALAFCNGLAESWVTPASKSVLLQIVTKKDLKKSLAIYETANQTAEFVFKAAGGFLLSLFRPVYLLMIDGLSFCLCAVAESRISLGKKAQVERPDEKRSLLSDFKEGAAYLSSQPSLVNILALIGLLNFFAIPGFVLLLPFLTQHFGEGVAVYGYGLSAMALGNIAGSAIFGKLPEDGLHVRLTGSAVSFALLWAVLPFQSSIAGVLLILFLAGVSQAVCRLTLQSLWLEKVDAKFVGRVSSMQTMLISFLIPVGMLVSGALGSLYSSTDVLVLSYIACALIFLAILSISRPTE